MAEILRISKLDWRDGGKKEKGRRRGGILLCNGLIQCITTVFFYFIQPNNCIFVHKNWQFILSTNTTTAFFISLNLTTVFLFTWIGTKCNLFNEIRQQEKLFIRRISRRVLNIFKYGKDVSFFNVLLNDHDCWMLIVPDQDIFEKNDFDFRDVHEKWAIPGLG